MPFHIFISYARKDAEKTANKIYDMLNTVPDLTVWMDRSLELAENWMQQIEDEIKRADYVIAIISPDVHRSRRAEVGSSFVIKEISFAQLLHKPILPVITEDTHLPLQIADLQYIDFSKNFYEALERTMNHICAKANITLQEFQRTVVPGQFELISAHSKEPDRFTLYKARSIDPQHIGNRPFLIKTIASDTVADNPKGIIEEAELLSDMRHPGVVRILPIHTNEGVQRLGRAKQLPNNPYYFAMEYLGGGDLDDIWEDTRFNLDWRLEFFYQVAIILDYLHFRNYVHQNITPENIMFRVPPRPFETPVPVLIGFTLNIDRPAIYQDRRTHQLKLYTPPEKVQAFLANESTPDHPDEDIWALGVIMYELLTGKYPFHTASSLAKIEPYLHQSPTTIEVDLPDQLQEIILAMLTQKPTDRPTTRQVIEAIEAV